jgi:hypothetical protein
VYCVNRAGKIGENVGGTYTLLLFDTGFGSALAVFTVVEIAARLAKRRAGLRFASLARARFRQRCGQAVSATRLFSS